MVDNHIICYYEGIKLILDFRDSTLFCRRDVPASYQARRLWVAQIHTTDIAKIE
jgi:hypothetical protein